MAEQASGLNGYPALLAKYGFGTVLAGYLVWKLVGDFSESQTDTNELLRSASQRMVVAAEMQTQAAEVQREVAASTRQLRADQEEALYLLRQTCYAVSNADEKHLCNRQTPR